MPDPAVLDPRIARRHFERAAESYAKASRIEGEIGARMLERLDYIKRIPRKVLDAGSGPPQRALRKRYPQADVVALDFALAMLRMGKKKFFERNPPKAVCADLARLPFAAGAFDLVWSNMALHWAADPQAVLRECHRALAVDGLLMFSTLGPDTLRELRAAAGGRVHAFADMHDLGDLLVASGFAEPVMDMERITLVYADGPALLADLRASGQTFALAAPSGAPPRGLAGRAFLSALQTGLAAQRAADGTLPISYEVVYGHAWKVAPKRSADGRSVVRFS